MWPKSNIRILTLNVGVWRPARKLNPSMRRLAAKLPGMKRDPKKSALRLTVPGMHESPSRYNVTVTVWRDQDGQLPDPVAFAVAADEAAWRRSASIVSAHMDDRIISIVTVHAPDRYAAVTVAHAVVSDALRHRAASADQPAGDACAGAQTPPPAAA
jgi:hypothetical protein